MTMLKHSTRAWGSPSRYIQGRYELDNIKSYTEIYGKKVFFLIDVFFYASMKEKFEQLYAGSESTIQCEQFGGQCTEDEILRCTAMAKDLTPDVVVGIGGGYSGYGYGGGYGGYGNYGGYGGYSAGNNTEYGESRQGDSYQQAAYQYIRYGRYQEAIHVLENCEERDARWYYLSALAHHGLGNQVTALEHIRRAVSMEPDNMEYMRLLNIIEHGGSDYRTHAGGYQGYGRRVVSRCASLMLCWLFNIFCCGGRCCICF